MDSKIGWGGGVTPVNLQRKEIQLNHYTEVHEQEGCAICETKRTGTPSIADTLLKVALLQSQHDELISLFTALEGYVSRLSMTDFMHAIDLLRGEDHAEVAGLVYHFMVNAMNMYTGGD